MEWANWPVKMIKPTEEQISHAIAQAWCTEENKHKEFDANLAAQILENIIELLES